ncbi:MAG: DUF2207 domain-containing protein [Bacteroidales bacterium]|nr:DUF2207 domain-containing protein [Bacteroidales bacterium]
MKSMRIFIFVAALCLAPAVLHASKVPDLNILVRLGRDGSAQIREIWDVDVDEGTEWYLTRKNLGDIEISGLRVRNEEGLEYINEGDWDTDRSIRQKAGRCGIVRLRDGCEICWGLGSHGKHTFIVEYLMSNVVKSLQDYDMMHLQLVNPGLSSPPSHVRVSVRADDGLGVQLDTSNTRIWGFGFVGKAGFEDGAAVFESTEHFQYMSSVIALLRFDKGIFSSGSVQDRPFQDALDRALEGADFGGNEKEDLLGTIFGMLSTLFFMFLFIIVPVLGFFGASRVSNAEKKRILGVKPSQVDWCRDVPFEGDLLASDYTLTRLGEDRKNNALASALILRMIYEGYLDVHKDASGKVEISFGSKDPETLNSTARSLFKMMKEASGSDQILQDKEFSKWSNKNKKRLIQWTKNISALGLNSLENSGWSRGRRYTESGQAEARKLMGLKKFLQDFTLTGERETVEVKLWQDYLVYGSLFGIANKVAKQLQDIDPVLFEQTVVYDYTTLDSVLSMTNNMARAITNASYVKPSTSGSSASWGGFGGGTSFGGGGGFSGGGFGGGAR